MQLEATRQLKRMPTEVVDKIDAYLQTAKEVGHDPLRFFGPFSVFSTVVLVGVWEVKVLPNFYCYTSGQLVLHPRFFGLQPMI